MPLIKSWALGPDYKQVASARVWAGVTDGRSLEAERLAGPAGLYHRERHNLTLDGGAEFNYSLGRHSLLIGADYQSMHDDGETIYDINPEADTRTQRNEPDAYDIRNFGLFGQLMLYPFERLSLTGSIRSDFNSEWGTNPTYRGAAVLEASRHLYLKGFIGTSYLPPAPSQLFAVPLVASGGVAGNPNLEVQKARTLEGAILLRLADSLKIDLTLFWTEISQRIENQLSGDLYVARNMTDSESLGCEVAAEYSYGALTVKADGAFQDTSLSDPDLVTYQWELAYGQDGYGDDAPSNFPHFLAHLNAALSLPEFHFGAAIIGTYVGPRKSSVTNIVYAQESYRLDPYFVLDLHLRTLELYFWEDRLTEASLHINNLLNQKFSHGGDRGVDIPAVGFSAILSLTQHI